METFQGAITSMLTSSRVPVGPRPTLPVKDPFRTRSMIFGEWWSSVKFKSLSWLVWNRSLERYENNLFHVLSLKLSHILSPVHESIEL